MNDDLCDGATHTPCKADPRKMDAFDAIYNKVQEAVDEAFYLGLEHAESPMRKRVVAMADEAADTPSVIEEPIVWADDASPFTGKQVLDLLKENEKLRAAIRPFAERVVEMGMLRAKVDKDDFWVLIGFAQSVWLNAAKVLVK